MHAIIENVAEATDLPQVAGTQENNQNRNQPVDAAVGEWERVSQEEAAASKWQPKAVTILVGGPAEWAVKPKIQNGVVAVALLRPYPECDEADLRATLEAVEELDPVTVFHEPINVRAENVERIRQHAESIGVTVNTAVFAIPVEWRRYTVDQLRMVERIAGELGLGERLHLWPDKSFVSNVALATYDDPLKTQEWILCCHGRISKWPEAEIAA